LGADRVYLLTAGTPCALDRAPSHPVAAALHGVTLLLQQHALLETAAEANRLDLRVIPPLCPLTVSAADFTQARTLIERARKAAGVWIDSGADRQPAPERFLSLHSHHRTRSATTPPPLAPERPAPPAFEKPVRAGDDKARRPRVRKPAGTASRRPAS
jgi:NTE family protein